MIKKTSSFCPGGPFHLTLHAPCPRSVLPGDWLALLSSTHDGVLRRQRATCQAVAVLPNGIHAVWDLPQAQLRPATRLINLKSVFLEALKLSCGGAIIEADLRKMTVKVHPIRRAADISRHVDDCHFAPVRYGWACYPAEWSHTTARCGAASDMILM
jgi:putative transposase